MHEATDCLIRQRQINPSLHVVLWQVGLIGELGYRRQGFLNNNFSYFIKWLQEIYGENYEITNYIGSRYPTIDPVIKTYKLSELHDPEKQASVTGISTFYIAPKDTIPAQYQVVKDLGLIKEGQQLAIPKSPLREIGSYGPREMKAFDHFARFRIPPHYKWQKETEASNFLIELRFDTKLQDLYAKDPQTALEDPRFSALSDRERSLLISRDSSAIQIASKGAYVRSVSTERAITTILNSKSSAVAILRKMTNLNKDKARTAFNQWLSENGMEVDWASLYNCIDYVNRNTMFPWTGVYIEPNQRFAVTIIGNQTDIGKSIIYLNDMRIINLKLEGGIIKWKSNKQTPFNGFIRPDVDLQGKRRIIGKVWLESEPIPASNNFVADEVNPMSKLMTSVATKFHNCNIREVYGQYAVRTNGCFFKNISEFKLSEFGLKINQQEVESFNFLKGKLSWTGGTKECYAGRLTFLKDPMINSIELYGIFSSKEEAKEFNCYGSLLRDEKPEYQGPEVPEWAKDYLVSILHTNNKNGGLLFWYKWEKQYFTSRVMNKYISKLI
ncbi:hypothetical protein [Xanthovirga aplysinae]|uniref:hypothetical protein n=1 Tax=Xanthovirga aplysinae TaxID=2529853 RepID=UPI0012BC5E1B|nr:hypothetical protein [Xanthovirga aplysinae]MTI29932.1 hypothetical protein [Xanthovirga aplysinae]